VPVSGQREPFIWGVWAQIGEPDFVRANAIWKTEGREEKPFVGWLNTPVPLYANTVAEAFRHR
jgi:hypothetical protein